MNVANQSSSQSAGPRTLAMVLAGGEGKRLHPLTVDRAKPAVPFGGHYRLIDFVLSNLVNGGYRQIVVLTQYKSHSLGVHISLTWPLSPLLGDFVTAVPAQMRQGPRWFLGSADAIFQNLNLIDDHQPDYVLVFGYQDPGNFSYLMMNGRNYNTRFFRVSGGVATGLTPSTERGVPDTNWHNVRLSRAGSTVTAICPKSLLNLLALLSRFDSTCTSRVMSASTSSGAGGSVTLKDWRRASTTGRIASTARSTTEASATRSGRSVILPLVMRDTSSRSSTSRVMCCVCRSITPRAHCWRGSAGGVIFNTSAA